MANDQLSQTDKQIGHSYESIFERLSGLLTQMDIPSTSITGQAHFSQDLGMDSLDYADLMMRIEREFNLPISDQRMDNIRTVDQAIDFLQTAWQS